ncbi:CorA family divalent cation transporter, partial [Acinetobacter baumannii]
MQVYYFYRHQSDGYVFISREKHTEHILEFFWIDSVRSDVVSQNEEWQQKIQQLADVSINEFHMRDIANIEHPCAFDTLEEYDLLIFRKLVTPDDEIKNGESHESVFGLATTPISFIFTPKVLISVREQGNKSIENYIQRLENILCKTLEEQNKTRKLPNSPVDLCLR